ncbi:MAG: hypothetical protein M3335_07725 [Actinomycetota bacterium]|nr:hypothetical protein [Actinomycetota bacterium]
MYGLTTKQIVFAVLMILTVALLGLVHVFFVGFSCQWDTSTCARSVEKTGVIEGTLRTVDGSPYHSSQFEVEFASREARSPVTFETDEEGRYCIQWASERVYPQASAPDGTPLFSEGEKDSLTSWRELDGDDPPPDCEKGSAGVPWHRADDAESTWQYWLLILLPLAAIAALAVAAIRRRQPYAPRFYVSGSLLFSANLLAFMVFWFLA